jgi:hypothetical protein
MLSLLCLDFVAAPNPSPGVEIQSLKATGRIHRDTVKVYMHICIYAGNV